MTEITNQNKPVVATLSVAQIIEQFFSEALKRKASDVHIEPQDKSIKIRFRVDGVFEPYKSYPESMKQPIITKLKILADLKIDESRIPQDGKAVLAFNDQQVDLRVSSLPTVYGEKIVIRILRQDTNVTKLESLGFLPNTLTRIQEALKKTTGIILATGPTGSGKSTSLFSILKTFNPEEENISTLEDPVELRMPGINQSQVHPSIGFDFASGLRSLVRQDPDIIMVGEIRDKETAQLAVEAALTGHLVLSTVHTNTAATTIERLTNMGVDSFLLGSTVRLIIAQRLARRVCTNCKEEEKLSPNVMEKIKNQIGDLIDQPVSELKFYKGKGCDKCKNSGFLGRIGIYEVVASTPELEKIINENKPAPEIEKLAIEQGMITLLQDGLLKAAMGATNVAEIFRIAGE